MPKKHDHMCDRDGCDVAIRQVPGPGRPRRFCSNHCRYLHRRETEKRALAEQAQVLAALHAMRARDGLTPSD